MERLGLMVPVNVFFGALGGFAIGYERWALTGNDLALASAVGGCVGMVLFMLSQVTRATRLAGAVAAFLCFTFGMKAIARYVLETSPGLIPVGFTNPNMFFVNVAIGVMFGIMVTVLWAKVNPHTPPGSMHLRYEK